MPCKEWNPDWVARLYEELTPDDERRLDEHLERCAECRSTLDALSASRRLLQQAAPAVPAAPRVVVLRPGLAWRPVWSFAAGAACALVLFSLGVIAAPRLLSLPPGGAAAENVAAQTVPADMGSTARPASDLLRELEAFERRLAQIEARPPEKGALTEGELQQALDVFEQRIHRTRAQDLDYMMKSITASEIRTGTWIDQTYDALNLLALRQDPRFSEQ